MNHRPLTRFAFCAAIFAANALTPGRASAEVTAGDAGGKLDLEASFGMLVAPSSPYRDAATALGYDRRTWRFVYEAEVAALFRPGWFGLGDALSVGPLARASLDRMSGPYDGVASIDADALLVGARAELRLTRFPVIFAWTDVAAGAAYAGVAGAHTTSYVLGARGGLGARIGDTAAAVRLRLGYAYQPTGRLSDRGGLDFGGFMMTLDGVLRALD